MPSKLSRTTAELPTSFAPLRHQLLGAAEAFATDAEPLADLLAGLVDDVERAAAEPLEIFPVCHHSPSSAVHMVDRLRARGPRVIFMEGCEDLVEVIDDLRECTLPVALQAFASPAEAFPAAWSPLSLVCPLTEFSAEYQAIAYALENPEAEIVFVDRSADHVFQWMSQTDDALQATMTAPDPDDGEEAGMHSASVGVEMGSLVPTFGEFTEFLLKNARVQYFSEWYDQYVEEAIIDGDYETYRQVMFLVGSLFRRLGSSEASRANDERRERYMWTRIKQELQQRKLDPSDAIYICGAAHAASRVDEFGIESPVMWDIPPRTATAWSYGILPSSYGSIEHQFGHPRGAITLAESRWKKSLRRRKAKPFKLLTAKQKKKASAKKPAKVQPTVEPAAEAPSVSAGELHPLLHYLEKPPAQMAEDEAELLDHAVGIVKLARKNGYLATTADSIAVYQTSVLLAGMRNRARPTPYDFRDAAITCIEKDRVPGKRNVSRLCDILLGGDRTGRIGYESLPPLAQNVYDRLEDLPIKVDSRTIQRALLDFDDQPELRPASELLWKLRYLLRQDVVRPIMGQKELGHVPRQESWDISIGKHQGAIIELAYEGVTVEQVVERRLKNEVFLKGARAATALRAVEDSIIFLGSERLTEDLGRQATALLVTEPDVSAAGDIYQRINKLVHYYRSQPDGLESWCQQFVSEGYSHYATMLPNAFSDRGTKPEDLASMLQFIFTLESLALSLGSERSQLLIAVRQSATGTTDPTKLALLWSAELVLGLRDMAELRAELNAILDNELTLPSLPDYLSGFLLALAFTPLVTGLAVELMSRAFERLPDHVLMPWLPKLIMTLRPHAETALPALIKEAASVFPQNLADLDTWLAPWDAPVVESAEAGAGDVAVDHGEDVAAVAALLGRHLTTTDAYVELLAESLN